MELDPDLTSRYDELDPACDKMPNPINAVMLILPVNFNPLDDVNVTPDLTSLADALPKVLPSAP